MGLRERLAAAGQEKEEPTATPEGPLFSAGQASTFVKDRIRQDIKLRVYVGVNSHSQYLIANQNASHNKCPPLIAYALPNDSSVMDW